ncbi:hypothetical protein [Ruegeria arenilitoris]|uniref:hypothetical protein n=1 Tax=Ruegeria arenilitoris TaxID=1173585 RepID=UPI00147EFD36|nr:hypothetical protein [Ruegeria arenilitoris]
MFHRAALDISDRHKKPDPRFYSCVRFVADSCTPAVFYLNEEWLKHRNLEDAGISVDDLLPAQIELLKKRNLYPEKSNAPQQPALVYLEEGAWEKPVDPETGAMSGLVVPNREFVLSPSPLIHKAHLADNGLNAQTAILCLASVGLDVMLPNVSFDLLADEEIKRMKEEFRDERLQYLEVASALAQQAYDRLKEGDYEDALRWAESEVAFKLAPKARLIEEAVSSHTTRQLRKAGYSFWKEGVPTIGAAYLSGGLGAASLTAGKEALRTLVATVSASKEERSLPEVAYAMKIKMAVDDRRA